MGRRSDFARRPHDDYQTVDPKAVAALLPYLKRDGIETFAEPCCGEGHLMQALLDLGFACMLASDIVDGPCADALSVRDFNDADAIITNPPWTREILHPMILHFQQHVPIVWLLFDSDWAYNAQAAPYLAQCTDIVAIGRLRWFNDTTGKDNASWYRFDKNHSSGPRFHGRNSMNIDVKPSDLIEEYIRMRDEKKQAEARFDELVNERYGDRMAVIEVTLLDMINKLGVDSISGKSGNAHRHVSVSLTIADAREFRRHVIGTESWDLANWSANKTTVNELVERGEPIPPGLNRTAIQTVQIRRK